MGIRLQLSGLTVGVWVCATSCVTTIEDIPRTDPTVLSANLTPLVIPFGVAGGSDRPVDQYYRSALSGLQDAILDRDIVRARQELGSLTRDDAPDWAKQQLGGFRLAVAGLEWVERLEDRARLRLPDPLPPLGADLRVEFEAAGLEGCGVRIPRAGEDRPRFGAFFEVADFDAAGSRAERQTAQILKDGDAVDLDRGDALRMPFLMTLGARGAVLRRIRVRIELLPGRVSTELGSAPVVRTVLVEREFELFPVGIERVRAEPLRVMRDAIRVGDPRFYAHQFLAAYLMPAEQQEAAARLQIDQLRLAERQREQVAMACLRQLTDDPRSDAMRTREQWLAWWNQRAADRGR